MLLQEFLENKSVNAIEIDIMIF